MEPTEEFIRKTCPTMWHIHHGMTKLVMSFVEKWIKLKIITVNELSQFQKDKHQMFISLAVPRLYKVI